MNPIGIKYGNPVHSDLVRILNFFRESSVDIIYTRLIHFSKIEALLEDGLKSYA